MGRYLLKRLFAAVITLLVASVAVSMLIHVVPGDPVTVMMAQSVTATPEAMAEMRQRLGLDLPLWQQYFHYMGQVLQGDFGRTIMGITEGGSIPSVFIPHLIDLYRAGRFPFDRMIKFYPFDQINQAAEDSEKGRTLKAILRFGTTV